MDALDALASIDAELQALSHPLGSLAYQQAVAQRAEPSGRDVLAYEDAPAPPLMDDELAEAMKQGAADGDQPGDAALGAGPGPVRGRPDDAGAVTGASRGRTATGPRPEGYGQAASSAAATTATRRRAAGARRATGQPAAHTRSRATAQPPSVRAPRRPRRGPRAPTRVNETYQQGGP